MLGIDFLGRMSSGINFVVGRFVKHLFFVILSILSLSLLAISPPKVTEFKNLKEKNGLIYHKDTNKVFSGISIIFKENTKKIKAKTTYVNGIKHGMQFSYYDNGNKSFGENFSNGRSDGLRIEW